MVFMIKCKFCYKENNIKFIIFKRNEGVYFFFVFIISIKICIRIIFFIDIFIKIFGIKF